MSQRFQTHKVPAKVTHVYLQPFSVRVPSQKQPQICIQTWNIKKSPSAIS